ncbi:MAG: hypothetical protein GJ676_13755 [Rhodobacteraceae bacterium]|nr:hypothetical protein [Paracoccaceae bacterium]
MRLLVSVQCLALLALLAFGVSHGAQARQDLKLAGLQAPTLVNEVTVRWLGLRLYKAALFTESGERFSWSEPMALQLTYLRDFSEPKLTKGTLDELQRIEGNRSDHTALMAKLSKCFTDVQAGDRFVAASPRPDTLSMWLNGRKTCTVSEPNIRKRFLGIWLSDQARSASLSRSLRGQ